MIHGVDISRYQGVEAMDGWGFVIVNVEDPGLAAKIERAKQTSLPWGLYTWIYPGKGRNDMQRSAACEQTLGAPPLGHWLDYEEAGVQPSDLSAALDHAGELGVLERVGVYTYLHLIDSVHGHLRGRPLWLAYYPGANDGTFPADQDGDARRWGAVLWQYTSSSGTLDRNVVIDDAWYQAFPEGDDMPSLDEIRGAVRDELNQATAPGQLTGAGTIAATLSTVQALHNQIQSLSSAVAQFDPSQIADAVVAQLPAGSVDASVVAGAVRDAVANELAQRLAQ